MLAWVRKLFSGGTRPGPELRYVREIKARYDNATTTDENRRHWWAADYLSAKSANSFQVRRQLRMRSRYEVANNPYLYGITNSNADDLIDTGPTLQVMTPDAGYNRAVESAWAEWAAEVALVEKLRTCKLAKGVDGEGFLVLKTVGDLEHPVKLYPCDVEADQVTTPAPTNLAELWVDGLTLHPVTGRPTAYHVLRHHPGDYFFPDFNPLRVEKISAQWVLHWFTKVRPGQVRGIPVFTASLDLFTELRAFRKAVLGAAEIAADFAAVLESDVPANTSDDDTEYKPFEGVPIDRKMMTTLPAGFKMSQFDPKQPATSYEMFQEKCLGEACRPLNYPLNLALGTSQKFNFSSAKLDHINYRNGLRVERTDCESTVLGKLFRRWHEEAVLCGAVPVGNGLAAPPFEWHWPGFPSIDEAVDSKADADRLAAGTLTYREFWARRGYDWRDVVAQQSAEKQELERLGLTFGTPVQRTETDTTTEDGDGPPRKKGYDPKRSHHPPAEAMAVMRQWLRADGQYDESKHPRGPDGKFGNTGSVSDSAKDLGDRAKGIAAKIKKYGAKAVAAAKSIKESAVHLAMNATWAAVSQKAVKADDILDTSHDYSKILNAKGTGDWLSTHVGIGGNAAAVVGSHLLAFGFTKVKQAIAKRRAAKTAKSGTGRRGWIEADDDTPTPAAEKAKAVAEVLAALMPALGCPEDQLPSAADILDWMHHHDKADAASVPLTVGVPCGA